MALLGLALFLGGFIAIGLAFGQSIAKVMNRGTTRKTPSSTFCLGLPIGAAMIVAAFWCWFNVPSINSQTGQPEDDYTINMGTTDEGRGSAI